MSFWELLVIIVVGLLVIGPERLPEALRTGALWIGRAKRAINNTRAEFEQQLGMDEIRRELHNEQVLSSLRELEQSTKSFENDINKVDDDIAAQIKRIEDSIDEPVPHEQDPNADAQLGLEPENAPAPAATKQAKESSADTSDSDASQKPDSLSRP